MNHTFFLRTEIEGATADMTFDIVYPDPIWPKRNQLPMSVQFSKNMRELDTLLAQGKIIAYGYTTLLPY